MRILVTGSTGMVGQAVVSDLLDKGHAVAAMSRRVRKRPGVENVLVGADHVPWGYFGTKVRAEAVVRTSAVPSSVLRFTQFYEFVDQALSAMSRLPVMISDRGIVCQPVDVRDVAERLTHRIAAGPSGGIEEYGGPEVLGFDDLVRQWLAIRGARRPIMHVRIPGKLGKGFRSGSLTTTSEPTGRITWKPYVAEKYL